MCTCACVCMCVCVRVVRVCVHVKLHDSFRRGSLCVFDQDVCACVHVCVCVPPSYIPYTHHTVSTVKAFRFRRVAQWAYANTIVMCSVFNVYIFSVFALHDFDCNRLFNLDELLNKHFTLACVCVLYVYTYILYICTIPFRR